MNSAGNHSTHDCTLCLITNLIIDLNPETETSPLELIFIIERLNDFQTSGSVVISNHGKFVSSESRTFNNFVMEFVRFILIMNSNSEDWGIWKIKKTTLVRNILWWIVLWNDSYITSICAKNSLYGCVKRKIDSCVI